MVRHLEPTTPAVPCALPSKLAMTYASASAAIVCGVAASIYRSQTLNGTPEQPKRAAHA